MKNLVVLCFLLLSLFSTSSSACTLTGNWSTQQVIGVPGIDNAYFANSAVKNPIDGTVWFGAWGKSDVTEIYTARVYKQTCGGKFILENEYFFPTNRIFWTGFIDIDSSGNVWQALLHKDATSFAQNKILLRKRDASTGTWSNISELVVDEGYDVRGATMTNIVVRGGITGPTEVFLLGSKDFYDHAFDGDSNYAAHYYTRLYISKWTSGSGSGTWSNYDLSTGASLSDGNHSEGNLLRVDSNGKVWAGGRQELNTPYSDMVHGLVWVENSSGTGFDLILDLRHSTTNFDSLDRPRGVAFSPSGTEYRLTYSYFTSSGTVSSVFKGTLSNPSLYTVVEDGFSYNNSLGSQNVYSSISWHPNNQIFISMWSSDSDEVSNMVNLLRVGGVDGPFSSTSIFSHQTGYIGGAVRDPMTVVDNGLNVWAIGGSLNYDTFSDARIYIKKMSCL